jgi:GDSL-like Lipase/Acylhydrolase family
MVTAQSNPSPWLQNAQPSIVSHGETQKRPYQNKPCSTVSYTLRHPDPVHTQTQSKTQACVTGTSFGSASVTSSLIHLTGASLAGELRNHNDAPIRFLPIPNKGDVIGIGSGAYASSFTIVKDIQRNSISKKRGDGTFVTMLKPDTPTQVISRSYEFQEPRFSNNGQWLIADSPFHGMTRVNTDTGEINSFGPILPYNTGLVPRYVSAISDTGRYAIIYEHTYQIFRLYDLTACTPVCRYYDLQAQFENNSLWPWSLDFSSETTVRFVSKNQLYTLTAPGKTESLIDYMAIGDSFASGEGAHDYLAYTDVQSPFNKCHLSRLAYPYLLTDIFTSIESVACSGAKVSDLLSTRQAEGKQNSEYDEAIYSQPLVGYRPQINFIDRYKPKNVTVSAGGNDIGFAKIISTCIQPGSCFTEEPEQKALSALIHQQQEKLTLLYEKVKTSAATGAHVYALGYPKIVAEQGECALNVRFDAHERTLANQIVQTLNATILSATSQAGVEFINLDDALVGHRLCEAGASDIAVNGVTLGDDLTTSLPLIPTEHQLEIFLTGRESYHPNGLGHRLLAQAIRNHIQNKLSPSPAIVQTLPAPNATTPVMQLTAQAHNTTGTLVPGLNIIYGNDLNAYGEAILSAKQILSYDAQNVFNACSLSRPTDATDSDRDTIIDACDGHINTVIPVNVDQNLSEIDTSSYNGSHMKPLLPVLAVVASLVTPTTVQAQSNLQPGTTNLQNQTQQTQNTGSLQTKTGNVQTSGDQSSLQDKSLQPLGVVSDPKQQTSGSVVQPSSDLSTDKPEEQPQNSSSLAIPVIGVVAITLLIAYFTITRDPSNYRTKTQRNETVEIDKKAEEEIKTAKTKQVNKKKKTPKTKVKKSSKKRS